MNRRETIAQYRRVNRNFENLFLPKVRKALHIKVKKVIDDLRNGGYNYAISKLSTDIGNEELTKAIQSLYVTVGLRHARLMNRIVQADVKKGFGFNQIWTEFILNYLNKFLIEKITFEVATTTRNALMKILTIGIAQGLGVDQMVDQLEDWPFERYQAARIVRTETNRASNVGATAQESTSEFQQQKEWISVSDFRTRGHKPSDHANHVKLNGVRIDADEFFIDPRNGDKLAFPGDPSASAASTINCRCQVAYIVKRDENGNPVPKRRSTVVIMPGQIRRPQIIAI